jgi:hypothetical protein
MFHPDAAPGTASYYVPSFEAAALSFEVEPITAPVHSDAEIETVMTSLGREPGGGLVVIPDGAFTILHRAQIILLAARNSVPAVYRGSVLIRDGGLLSYGPDFGDIFRRAASYVDRTLRGAKPADLPVQVPVKFEMAVNVKTAKALGLTIPQSILLRADEVIDEAARVHHAARQCGGGVVLSVLGVQLKAKPKAERVLKDAPSLPLTRPSATPGLRALVLRFLPPPVLKANDVG